VTTAGKIVVVDDEPRIQRLVEEIFEPAGYAVHAASTAAEGLELVGTLDPDLVLLDVMMPDGNGLDLCQRIRATSVVPIILLTGLRNESDIVAGLEAGADDYVTKPFSPRELLARAEANLRRRSLDASPTPPSQIGLDGGRFLLDFGLRTVRAGEKEAVLTPREFAILGYLALNAGRVVPHDELIRHVWGASDPSRVADLRTYVKLIRRKIEDEPSQPRYLQSRAGAGYLLPRT
jgi:two-component system KDP operon response regulator KdpE